MKKLLVLALAVVSLSTMAYAVAMDVWLSSNTATADTTKNLCMGTNYLVGTTTITVGNHGVFHAACVNQGVATGTLAVYNSSGTATVPIATIQTSTAMPCSTYDVGVSSGLTYTNSTTANVSILYTCY